MTAREPRASAREPRASAREPRAGGLPPRLVRLSKRMSYLLRHHPDAGGLTLDEAGWVAVDDLLGALGGGVTRSDLDEVVARNDKRRFAVRPGPDGRELIRASQGHSVPVALGLPAAAAPPTLYHGTSATALPSIQRTGLHRGRRHHVHLSADVATATAVGARRPGPVVVLVVDAGAMAADGYTFHRSENGVWLTSEVPPGYLAPAVPATETTATETTATVRRPDDTPAVPRDRPNV